MGKGNYKNMSGNKLAFKDLKKFMELIKNIPTNNYITEWKVLSAFREVWKKCLEHLEERDDLEMGQSKKAHKRGGS